MRNYHAFIYLKAVQRAARGRVMYIRRKVSSYALVGSNQDYHARVRVRVCVQILDG